MNESLLSWESGTRTWETRGSISNINIISRKLRHSAASSWTIRVMKCLFRLSPDEPPRKQPDIMFYSSLGRLMSPSLDQTVCLHVGHQKTKTKTCFSVWGRWGSACLHMLFVRKQIFQVWTHIYCFRLPQSNGCSTEQDLYIQICLCTDDVDQYKQRLLDECYSGGADGTVTTLSSASLSLSGTKPGWRGGVVHTLLTLSLCFFIFSSLIILFCPGNAWRFLSPHVCCIMELSENSPAALLHVL